MSRTKHKSNMHNSLSPLVKPSTMSDDEHLKLVAPRLWHAHHAPPVPTWWPRFRSEYGLGVTAYDPEGTYGKGESLESGYDREMRWRLWYADYMMNSRPD